jgi:hypothetical protein
MDDTRSDIAEKVREMFQMKSPVERLKMGFSMYETSKYLVARAIFESTSVYSGANLRQELFLRFYANDFDSATRQKILDHLGPTPAEPKAAKSITVVPEKTPSFEHIPESEKKQEWWIRLYPLVQARLSREEPKNSKLLKVLGNGSGFRTWKDVKNSIEIALKNVKNGERILARTSEIRKSPDPDGIIDDMFGELRTIPYLLIKGFKNISYSRRYGLDFKAEFDGKVFHIESTYVHGPDFKTQEYVFANPRSNNTYKILPDKLIRLFERVYSNKEKQVKRSHGTADNSLIFMITDLEETYAPWLEHAQIQGIHPILNLILNWEIPVIIFGCGSVYEPRPDSLGGIFGTLQTFDWQHFADQALLQNSV